ncbi:MAG TPA: hypothetical protein VG206_13310 [Terriglobia bacterium]|nr:hypothetical protein [Terriglobia bacterium]
MKPPEIGCKNILAILLHFVRHHRVVAGGKLRDFQLAARVMPADPSSKREQRNYREPLYAIGSEPGIAKARLDKCPVVGKAGGDGRLEFDLIWLERIQNQAF